jgi:hypothetical protein
VNETQKWATSKKSLRTTDLHYGAGQSSGHKTGAVVPARPGTHPPCYTAQLLTLKENQPTDQSQYLTHATVHIIIKYQNTVKSSDFKPTGLKQF